MPSTTVLGTSIPSQAAEENAYITRLDKNGIPSTPILLTHLYGDTAHDKPPVRELRCVALGEQEKSSSIAPLFHSWSKSSVPHSQSP
jgi:hypothetical protein